ncbi:hypothetical protein WG906_16390 [Pedobacter sp. P351]|uniref:hypothetical protein n=1 Tax=Pedobacter superstes TaxID=3133441 RepID=UPI0030A3EDE4
MKNLVIALFMLAASVSFSKAQGGGQGGFQQRTPEERVKMQLERLPQTLKLTDDQKTKISAIYLGQAKSRDSLFTAIGPNGDREVMRTKMTEMSAATDKKVLVLLSEEQKKAYNAYVQERGARGFGGGGGGQRPPQGN